MTKQHHQEALHDTVRLDDLLRANGDHDLQDQLLPMFRRVSERPPLFFRWYDENVDAFVRVIIAARAQSMEDGAEPLPEDPLHLPEAIDSRTVKQALLQYARARGAAAPLGVSCLPCHAFPQAGHVMFHLSRLDGDPWTRRVLAAAGDGGDTAAKLPIACVYAPETRSQVLNRAVPRLPGSLWG